MKNVRLEWVQRETAIIGETKTSRRTTSTQGVRVVRNRPRLDCTRFKEPTLYGRAVTRVARINQKIRYSPFQLRQFVRFSLLPPSRYVFGLPRYRPRRFTLWAMKMLRSRRIGSRCERFRSRCVPVPSRGSPSPVLLRRDRFSTASLPPLRDDLWSRSPSLLPFIGRMNRHDVPPVVPSYPESRS